MNQEHFGDQPLTPNEKTIADYISKNGVTILTYTEDEIAKELQISNATVSRFWRKIGFKNFKDFTIRKKWMFHLPISSNTSWNK